MENILGKKLIISGMTIEIIADDGDNWETYNLTTKETLFMNKLVLDNAIKLGKAEEITD
ncbi:MAG: hypothetical protein OEW97_07795 [Gammaproteobacteria bacterium]|nr:hypothetical protein [Gammaproteobacteria bacterium]